MSAVTSAAFAQNRSFPLVIERSSNEPAAAWAATNRAALLAALCEHGAVLFRGFGVYVDTLRDFVGALSDSLEPFAEESSPRSMVARDVFTSTDYPSDFPIQFHNEFSYSARWPMKLFFCCIEAPRRGGSTPIADCRRVLSAMSESTRRRFAECGVLYQRNYLSFMGVRWQDAFGTQQQADVDTYCRENGMQARWENGDELRTQHVTQAIVRHPLTGDAVWFNHGFFFNVRAIEPVEVREALLLQPEFCTNTCFGDGTPIDQETIEELRAAYAAASAELPWCVGDVLMIDNMLTAHARQPFAGPRRIVVSMSDPCARRDLASARASG